LHKLLDKDPKKRPTVVEMMSHKWFNPIFDNAQEFEGDEREEDVEDNFLLNEEVAK
jgi:serine/threonine protein kinase